MGVLRWKVGSCAGAERLEAEKLAGYRIRMDRVSAGVCFLDHLAGWVAVNTAW